MAMSPELADEMFNNAQLAIRVDNTDLEGIQFVKEWLEEHSSYIPNGGRSLAAQVDYCRLNGWPYIKVHPPGFANAHVVGVRRAWFESNPGVEMIEADELKDMVEASNPDEDFESVFD